MSISILLCHLMDIVFCQCDVLLLWVTWTWFVFQCVRLTFPDVFISFVVKVVADFVLPLFQRLLEDFIFYAKHYYRTSSVQMCFMLRLDFEAQLVVNCPVFNTVKMSCDKNSLWCLIRKTSLMMGNVFCLKTLSSRFDICRVYSRLFGSFHCVSQFIKC